MNRDIKNKKIVPILAAFALIIIVIIISVISGIIKKYTPTDERVDLKKHLNLAEEEDIAVLLQNELSEIKGRFIDGVVYINYETVKTLNQRFYWDAKENLLLYTTPTDIIKVEVGSKDYMVSKNKNSENYVILKTDGSDAYIALDYIKKYTELAYEYHKDPNRVHITYQFDKIKMADVRDTDVLRVKGGIKSPILADVVKGDQVEVIEEGENWSKVRSQSGYVGYIKNKKLATVKEQEIKREPFVQPEYTHIKKDYKINMAWHQVTTAEANDNILSMIANTKGLNTISPTWFALSDNEGNISSLASTNYVNYAHQAGLEVWGLVNNFDENVSTYEVLSSTSRRERLTNQLLAAAIQYELDGINVDFEKVSEEAGDAFIQFIRELSIKCRNNGIVLSVDNYVPKGYNSHYFRKEQGIVADYVIIMGYDEHFAGSDKSGSVASINFVREGIEKTLEEVPAEKVINALPFYTRIWKETPKTQEEIDAEDKNSEFIPYKLSSEAAGMDKADKFLSDYEVTPVWDEASAQFYAEFEADGSVYKVWLEEETSIEEKLKLIQNYKLAGVAAWKLGLERQSIWDLILRYVN